MQSFHVNTTVNNAIATCLSLPKSVYLTIALLTLLLFVGVPSQVFADGSIIVNGDFENRSQDSSWKKWPPSHPGAVGVEDCCGNHTPYGSRDAYIQPNSTSQEIVLYQDFLTNQYQPGQVYHMKAWVTSNGQNTTYLRWYNPQTGLNYVCGQVPTDARWPVFMLVSCDFVMPSGTDTPPRFNIQLAGTASPGIWVIIDDWTLSPGIAKYDRSAAVKYSDYWSHGRNSQYPNYGGSDGTIGNDCTNFVSQVLESGGYIQRGAFRYDAYSWWHKWDFIALTHTNSNTWSAADWMNQYVSNHTGAEFDYLSDPYQMQPGDFFLIQDISCCTIPSHARMIVGYGYSQDVIKDIPRGTWGLLANQHSTDRYRVIWNDGFDPFDQMWYIHVRW